jgi:hypothetical protein
MDRAGFMEALRASSAIAASASRERAVAHYASISGATMEQAGLFYEAVRSAMSAYKVVANMEPADLPAFLRGEAGRFGRDPADDEAVGAIGCLPLAEVHVQVTGDEHGDRSKGECSIVLAGLDDGPVVVGGKWRRLTDPNAPDFAKEPFSAVFDSSRITDARACAAIHGLSLGDVAGGPEMALRTIVDGDKGACQGVLLGGVSPRNIGKIVVASDETLQGVRTVLGTFGRLLPVASSGPRPPSRTFAPAPSEPVKQATSRYLEIGDRVRLKRAASHPDKRGQVVESANGRVAVQWDDDSRDVMGLGEALMTLMPEPRTEPLRLGAMAYELGGVDEESVAVMCRVGVDPVNVVGLASHFAPSSPSQEGWRDALVAALRGLGLPAKEERGIAPLGNGSLGPKSWIEARLPLGNRLVLDLTPGKMIVRAGLVDDYVVGQQSLTRLYPEME